MYSFIDCDYDIVVCVDPPLWRLLVMRKFLILAAVFWQTLNISAYCETGNPTASGVWPQTYVTCAADHLPFGTRITLPDGSVWIVQDRFGGGYHDRLDLFLPTEAACWKFGRQWLRCRIEVAE